jgi:putative aldouronate transport system permease protein
MLNNLLSSDGVVNQITAFFGQPAFSFLTNTSFFRVLIFISDSWKEMGYGCIIYLAAIAGINPEQYEAAYVDGAGRWQQLIHITLPSIKGTIILLFILQVGGAMNGGFDQIFNIYNNAVFDVADIIDTFVYRRTFNVGASFGTSTAIGLFKSVINFGLLLTANYVVRFFSEESLV